LNEIERPAVMLRYWTELGSKWWPGGRALASKWVRLNPTVCSISVA